MSWNYRVIRDVSNGKPFYTIREVYYKKDDIPHSLTREGCHAQGDTKDEMIRDLVWMIKAITKPTLGPDLKEIEPATFLADELLKTITENPHQFADLISAKPAKGGER